MIRSVFALFVISTTLTFAVFAGQPLVITSFTIDGGGGMRSEGGPFNRFVISGTIGQPDAGEMTGGGFRLTGGFWHQIQPGDCNRSGIIDLVDQGALAPCLTGPDGDVSGECVCFDGNGDFTVDLADFAETQNVFGSQ